MDKIEKMENVSWPSSSTSLLTRGVFPLAVSLAVKFYTISPVDSVLKYPKDCPLQN